MNHTHALPLALARELAAGDRVGEDSSSNLLLHVPLGGTLGLPGPVKPAGSLLKGIKLGLDELAQVVTISLGESCHSSNRLAITATVHVAALVGSVIAGTNTLTIQVLSTISHGASPFTNDGPLVRVQDVLVDEVADIVGVTLGVHSKQAAIKDFVVVSVHHDIPDTSVHAHEFVPGFCGHKSIVKDHSGILARLTYNTPSVIVVLLQVVLVDATRNAGLIEGLNSGDDIGVTLVPLSQRLQSRLSV